MRTRLNKKIFGDKKSISLGDYLEADSKIQNDPNALKPEDFQNVLHIVVYNGSLLSETEKQQELLKIGADFKTTHVQIVKELEAFAKELGLE